MKPAELNEALVGRLCAEDCRDLSDAELYRCLRECVCGHTLIPLAQSLRGGGALVMSNGAPAMSVEAVS